MERSANDGDESHIGSSTPQLTITAVMNVCSRVSIFVFFNGLALHSIDLRICVRFKVPKTKVDRRFG